MSTQAWDIVVIGGANWDYLVVGPRLPDAGETVQGHLFREGPGGKGVDQAVAAARLGARVAFVGRVGTDERGDRLLAALTNEGVDTTHVTRDSINMTGCALQFVEDRADKASLVAPGANLAVTAADVIAARHLIENSRLLLTQLELPLPTITAAIRLAASAGTKILLDPSPSQGHLSDDLLKQINVIKPNAREATALTGITVTDLASARRAAAQLLAKGVGAVAIQAGVDGDLLVWHDGERWLPRLNVKAVDATGAGDAFAAALAVMLIEGRSLSDAGLFASATAALTTTGYGSQAALPRRTDVEALLKKKTILPAARGRGLQA